MTDLDEFNTATDRLRAHLGAWAGRHQSTEIRVRAEADHVTEICDQLRVLAEAIAKRVTDEALDYDVETAAVFDYHAEAVQRPDLRESEAS